MGALLSKAWQTIKNPKKQKNIGWKSGLICWLRRRYQCVTSLKAVKIERRNGAQHQWAFSEGRMESTRIHPFSGITQWSSLLRPGQASSGAFLLIGATEGAPSQTYFSRTSLLVLGLLTRNFRGLSPTPQLLMKNLGRQAYRKCVIRTNFSWNYLRKRTRRWWWIISTRSFEGLNLLAHINHHQDQVS